jgi:DNA-binding NarL/FixJ family response regulator
MKQTVMKVFVADDHPIVTFGVSAIIQQNSEMQLVGTAASSAELFDALPTAKPHVLLLDLNMPGDDFSLNLQLLKEQFPWIKIIAYTQYSSPDLIRKLLREGVLGFLPKASTKEDLYEAVLMVYKGERYVHTSVSFAAPGESAKPSFRDDFRKRLGLSKREQEILELISKGLTSNLIGQTLFISKHTVETHRKNILRKLDFNSSTELVRFAVQQGLV